MACGLGLLRLEPKAFWSMTMKELSSALGVLAGATRSEQPPGRRDMTTLMAAFPDREVMR